MRGIIGKRFWLALALSSLVGCGVQDKLDEEWGPAANLLPDEPETVVLVHGLGRTWASMAVLGERLEDAGYTVVNFGYPSTTETLESLVTRLRIQVEECCAAYGMEKVHFVTHSMGGIVVRAYLADYSPEHEGRVVMLSPPNQGSEITDVLAGSPLLQSLLGPAGAQLRTDSTAIPAQLGPATFELGIITGDLSLNPVASWLIPGPDDGKVAVSSARLEGSADFLVLPATHTFIMNRLDVAEETARFLREGRFSGRSR